MDIVVPYRKSVQNGLELRYTLRGIEMYVKDRSNIFIIGDCPEFLQNIIHLPAGDNPDRKFKQRNIYLKLMAACHDKRVSDPFVWFSDDHFLLQEFQPHYNYRSTLQGSISNFTIHQTYRQTLINTFDYLQGGYDYGHCPMVFRKDYFIRSMDCVNWNMAWGYAIKSLYCVLNGLAGEWTSDLKIKMPFSSNQILRLIRNLPFFSLDDRALNDDMKQVLKNLYPYKSIYEKN